MSAHELHAIFFPDVGAVFDNHSAWPQGFFSRAEIGHQHQIFSALDINFHTINARKILFTHHIQQGPRAHGERIARTRHNALAASMECRLALLVGQGDIQHRCAGEMIGADIVINHAKMLRHGLKADDARQRPHGGGIEQVKPGIAAHIEKNANTARQMLQQKGPLTQFRPVRRHQHMPRARIRRGIKPERQAMIIIVDRRSTQEFHRGQRGDIARKSIAEPDSA